jgi:AcrR family transcriptional regulator
MGIPCRGAVIFKSMANTTKHHRFFNETLILIYKKGFKATTIRDIAQNLQCEVANVYNYIESKQSFLEESLFGIQQEFLAAMDTIVRSDDDAIKKLELIIASYIKTTAQRPYEQALLVNEWRNLSEPKLEGFLKRRRDYERQLQTVVQQGIEMGMFRNMDSEIVTQIILGTLRWCYQRFINPKASESPELLEKQLIDFIFVGLRAK